jgi:hypothetical protein
MSNPLDSIIGEHGWLYAIAASLAGVWGWLRYQRRGLSGDNAAMADDSAKVGMISRLERELDKALARADAAEARERKLAEDLAAAKAAVDRLSRDVSRERAKRIHRTGLLPKETQDILGGETRPAEFDELPTKREKKS